MHACAASDEELMNRFQRELDYSAFEQLFRRQKDDLLRFLLRLVRDRAAADDASQQAWLKVIEVAHRGGYRAQPGAVFRAWLFTMARNLVIDEHHRKFAAARTMRFEDWSDQDPLGRLGHLHAAPEDPAESASREQLAERLHAAIMQLPREQREVIALWSAGIDPAVIAATARAPRETVFSRKKYAIAKLRIALSDMVAS
jgi:RNA polymerase sigma-70 factor (ECF subfamily)